MELVEANQNLTHLLLISFSLLGYYVYYTMVNMRILYLLMELFFLHIFFLLFLYDHIYHISFIKNQLFFNMVIIFYAHNYQWNGQK